MNRFYQRQKDNEMTIMESKSHRKKPNKVKRLLKLTTVQNRNTLRKAKETRTLIPTQMPTITLNIKKSRQK